MGNWNVYPDKEERVKEAIERERERKLKEIRSHKFQGARGIPFDDNLPKVSFEGR